MTPLATDDAALAAYSALFASTLATTTTEYLRWLYAANPHGAAVGMNEYAGDMLAGNYGPIPMTARVDGVATKGLLSLNTATHPSHQGKGLFTRLAEATYASAAERGYDFVVGVANANSTPGFTRKLGFQLVAPLDVLVGVGSVEPGDAPVAFSVDHGRSLEWRLSRPGASYVRSGDSVFARAHGVGILAFLARTPLAERFPRARLTDRMRMWIGIDPSLRKRGVLAPLPDRLKPSPLNLIFRDLRGSRTLDKNALRFTLLDFDAY